jgi:hypothetical protein
MFHIGVEIMKVRGFTPLYFTTHTTGRPFILNGNVHVCALSNIFCHRYIKIRHSEIIYLIVKYILFLTVKVKLYLN